MNIRSGCGYFDVGDNVISMTVCLQHLSPTSIYQVKMTYSKVETLKVFMMNLEEFFLLKRHKKEIQ